MKKVSIDIAERNGSDLRRRLLSAERLSDKATAFGFGFLKTPDSRSSALLVAVTRPDQPRPRREADRMVLSISFQSTQHPYQTEERATLPQAIVAKDSDGAAHFPAILSAANSRRYGWRARVAEVGR
jgi:hypothetical protein